MLTFYRHTSFRSPRQEVLRTSSQLVSFSSSCCSFNTSRQLFTSRGPWTMTKLLSASTVPWLDPASSSKNTKPNSYYEKQTAKAYNISLSTIWHGSQAFNAPLVRRKAKRRRLCDGRILSSRPLFPATVGPDETFPAER